MLRNHLYVRPDIVDRQTLSQIGTKSGLRFLRYIDDRQAHDLIPGKVPFRSLVVAGLSCFVADDLDRSREGQPHGQIAPFARRNFYQETVHRLQTMASEIRQIVKVPKKDLRIFCNSRLPEKKIAFRSGLGFYGKNSLIIHPSLGSLFVIGILTLPFPIESDRPIDAVLGQSCADCRACISNCPVEAIIAPGVIDESRCLQSLSTQTNIFPEEIKEAWGFRLYGCQSCQDVCPYNSHLSDQTLTGRGEIGASIPLKEILKASPTELVEKFQGSTLGMNWIPKEAIRRNALLAAGHRGDPTVLEEIQRLISSPETYISDAASWAMRRISVRTSSSVKELRG